MASNHARHEAGEQIHKEWKRIEKHPAPDTALEEAEAIIFNLYSIPIRLTLLNIFGLCNLGDNELVV